MIYFLVAIIIFFIIETYYIEDFSNIFKYNGIMTVIAGYLMIALNYVLKNVINKRINFINVSKITDLIFNKAVNRGLILILLGGVELIVFIIIYIYKKRRIINK